MCRAPKKQVHLIFYHSTVAATVHWKLARVRPALISEKLSYLASLFRLPYLFWISAVEQRGSRDKGILFMTCTLHYQDPAWCFKMPILSLQGALCPALSGSLGQVKAYWGSPSQHIAENFGLLQFLLNFPTLRKMSTTGENICLILLMQFFFFSTERRYRSVLPIQS